MNRVKEIRLEKGLTSAKLAKLAGCKQSDISNIETGKKMPRAEKMQRIADALGHDVNYVFDIADVENNTETINIRISPTLREMVKSRIKKIDMGISEYIKCIVINDIENGETGEVYMETIYSAKMLKLLGYCYERLLYVLNKNGNDFNGDPTRTMLKSFVMVYTRAVRLGIPKDLDKKIEELFQMVSIDDMQEHFNDPVPNELYICFESGKLKARKDIRKA